MQDKRMNQLGFGSLSKLCLLIVLWLGGIAGTSASEILQAQISGYRSIIGYAPVGQTFTAEDSRVSTIGFFVDNWTHLYQLGFSFRYDLYEGVSVGGPFLGSASVTLYPGFRGYADANFGFANLSVGHVYIINLAAP